MASNDGENRGPEQDRAKIRKQLDRILKSAEFQAADPGRRFLSYVVEEALEGRSEQLNVNAIAQAVFGRDVGLDPQSDPVVHIEAGRIRRALERYYLVCGSNDPVIITIPKGHYAPSFEQRSYGPGASASSSPMNNAQQRPRRNDHPLTYRDLLVPIGVPAIFGALAVLALIRPLEHYLEPSPVPQHLTTEFKQEAKIVVEPLEMRGVKPGGAEIARGLSDKLISQLTKLDGVVVLTPDRPIGGPPAEPVFNLQGSVAFEDNSIHVQIRLIRNADGSVVWAERFDHDTQGRNVLDLQDEIGRQIVKDISQVREIKAGLHPS
jgi:TolB-like protein